uniref:Uncharacterized protein n=1 Tax=virus sp. ctML55 TaxID=2827627 RepID=A0A8S5RHL7_9VIRU|nr:MAG TPA: hypothetical protein [virus sp. ctML55]
MPRGILTQYWKYLGMDYIVGLYRSSIESK